MSQELKVGDVVRLKSGGPYMTVTALLNYTLPSVRVAWFPGHESIQEAELSRDSLKIENLVVQPSFA